MSRTLTSGWFSSWTPAPSWSVDVTDVARDRLAARATVTFAVLEPR